MKRITSLIPALALVLAGGVLAPAHADDRTTLLVVGTSDVSDSGLMSGAIEPGFEAAYPQYDLKYVPSGTGAAIAAAETGSAAALIVHAMSLENQFVADGYSSEPFGRAIFWGDYVLAGPANDPAGVLSGGGEHDIVTAFEKIAAAGAQGDANFVSRGGNPGTTVQEHALWALADSDSVQTCKVSSSNGGGASPYTASGDCPSTIGAKGDSDADFPSWYHATGATQGANIINADACSYGDDSNNCYVFTDRGTFQYEKSIGAIANLKLLTRNNTATSARGGIPALVNTFHAYVINPDAPGFAGTPAANLNTNVTGATALLNWITSTAGQAAIAAYQAPDPSFIPSAAPQVTVSTPPASLRAGKTFTITGGLTNSVLGMPALNGVAVHLEAVPAAGPGITAETVASAVTDANGKFSLSYRPSKTMIYTVTTDQITKLENSSLDPTFSDILQPTRTSTGTVKVAGSVVLKKPKVKKHKVTLKGLISPKAADSSTTVAVYIKHPGKKAKLKKRLHVAAGHTKFKGKIRLKKGTWRIHVVYSDGSAITPASSKTKKVRIH